MMPSGNCPSCYGTGFKDGVVVGDNVSKCTNCNGTGSIPEKKKTKRDD